DSTTNEGLHLAAAMQFCGFRSVIGTMWGHGGGRGDLSEPRPESIAMLRQIGEGASVLKKLRKSEGSR
ncbi:hypothetical protein EDB89DRAFT_1850519, partial [Lactarius sanguifluus]